MVKLPEYREPDFNEKAFDSAPDIRTVAAPGDGILPDDYYATNIYPEYFKIAGKWRLIDAARMDCAVVVGDGRPVATEARRIKRGDAVVIGREEDLSNGVFTDFAAFQDANGQGGAQSFAFRMGKSRETSFPEITTSFTRCCGTTVRTGASFGCWAPPSPSITTPESPWPD
jgi:hypothetical protein